MAKRTLTLRVERLDELTTDELDAVIGAVAAQTNDGICRNPTVPDVNRCPTLFC